MSEINLCENTLVSVLIPANEKCIFRQIVRRPFYALEKGNVILDAEGNVLCTVDEPSHKSGDASYDGWLFYDTNGESHFPEEFASTQHPYPLQTYEYPIEVVLDEGLTRQAHTFQEYANLMQFPEPTFVKMDDNVNDFIVIISETFGRISAYDALLLGTYGRVDPNTGECRMDNAPNYGFTDSGREYIRFATRNEMMALLRWKGIDVDY